MQGAKGLCGVAGIQGRVGVQGPIGSTGGQGVARKKTKGTQVFKVLLELKAIVVNEMDVV